LPRRWASAGKAAVTAQSRPHRLPSRKRIGRRKKSPADKKESPKADDKKVEAKKADKNANPSYAKIHRLHGMIGKRFANLTIDSVA
jgi:hypothetical protein